MDVGHLLTDIPQKHKYQHVRSGDTVRVHYRVVEGERVRTQVLQGIVIWMTRGGPNANITIRRIIQGIGVERTFLLNSPRLEQIEVVRQGRVRRARLYYQRQRTGRKARIRESTRPRPVLEEEAVVVAAAPPEEAAVADEQENVDEVAVANESSEVEEETAIEEAIGGETTDTDEPDTDEPESKSTD
jgi:large subunit ribosomal protein L19